MRDSNKAELLVVFGCESFFKSCWPFSLCDFFSPLSGISQINIQNAIDSLKAEKFDFVYVSLNEMCSNPEESSLAENHVLAMIPEDLKEKVFISSNCKNYFTDELVPFIAEKMPRRVVTLKITRTKKISFWVARERIKKATNTFSKSNPAIALVKILEQT